MRRLNGPDRVPGMSKHTTREGWLMEAVELLEPIIRDKTGLKPRKIRVSCGWPSRGGTRSSSKTIGQCFLTDDGKIPQIFISPVLEHYANGEKGATGYGVLPTLAHEMIHAYLPPGTGHKAPFSRAAKALGFEGKPTSTYANENWIKDICDPIVEKIGPYPHDALNPDHKKQTTRLLKVECPECGYVIRVTQKWIETGLPTCPCGTMMECDLDRDERLDHLKMDEQMQEFSTNDGRFSLRLHARGKVTEWRLIDWEHGKTDDTPGQPRMITVEDKYTALDLMDSIREGLTTLDELEEKGQEEDPSDFLDEDEDEVPDYDDEFDPDRDLFEWEKR